MQSPYLHETLTTFAITSKKIPGIPFTSSRACLKKALRKWFFRHALVVPPDLTFLNQWIPCQCGSVQIFTMHVDRSDLVVFIGIVVINTFRGIAAGCIQGNLIFTLCHLTASSLFINRARGNCGLNGVFTILIRSSSSCTSFMEAHCPRIHGISSNCATFSLPSCTSA